MEPADLSRASEGGSSAGDLAVRYGHLQHEKHLFLVEEETSLLCLRNQRYPSCLKGMEQDASGRSRGLGALSAKRELFFY